MGDRAGRSEHAGRKVVELFGEAELIRRAEQGEADAFTELYDRLAPMAWRYAWAATASSDAARTVVVESFGRLVGRIRNTTDPSTSLELLLLRAVTDGAADHRDAVAPVGQRPGADPGLEASFVTLPALWRATLWLGSAELRPMAEVATATGQTEADASAVYGRALTGIRERLLRIHAGDARPACRRAVDRLSTRASGTLDAGEAEALERHLGLCADCEARQRALTIVPSSLHALAPTLPTLLIDDARIAWTAACTPVSTGMGLSRRTERAIAVTSAAAAAFGVAGAALFGLDGAADDDGRQVAKPIAPIVTDVSNPVPIELAAAVELPAVGATAASRGLTSADGTVTASDKVGTVAPLGQSGSNGAPFTSAPSDDDRTPFAEGPGGDDTTPPAPVPETPVPAPTATVSLEVGGQPVAAAVGTDPGVTVGPVSAGNPPESSGEPEVGGALEPVQPMVAEIGGSLP